MSEKVTVIAPITLADGKTEADLLAASARFQKEFVDQQSGVLRRELVRKGAGEYLDIVQFRSKADAEDIMEKEKESPVCHAFFEVMKMDMEAMDGSEEMDFYHSLETYG